MLKINEKIILHILSHRSLKMLCSNVDFLITERNVLSIRPEHVIIFWEKLRSVNHPLDSSHDMVMFKI